MTYSMLEVLKLTIVSMGIVFAILLGIMFLMILMAKLFSEEEKTISDSSNPKSNYDERYLSMPKLFDQDPFARVAVFAALSEASQDKDGRSFQIESIKRIK